MLDVGRFPRSSSVLRQKTVVQNIQIRRKLREHYSGIDARFEKRIHCQLGIEKESVNTARHCIPNDFPVALLDAGVRQIVLDVHRYIHIDQVLL
jgi:hypothetical protein